MAQFDVHRNKGALRDSIPFVVVVQSAQFDRYRRRVVVPLVRQALLPVNTPTVGARMNPVFVVDGVQVVLHTLDMVSVADGPQEAARTAHSSALPMSSTTFFASPKTIMVLSM